MQTNTNTQRDEEPSFVQIRQDSLAENQSEIREQNQNDGNHDNHNQTQFELKQQQRQPNQQDDQTQFEFEQQRQPNLQDIDIYEDDEQYFRRTPTFFESVISGSVAAMTETLALHWTSAQRFREQVGAPSSASLRVLYNSLLPDLLSMIPITVCQIWADATLRRWMGGDGRMLSTSERITAAMMAGAVVSPLASYAEMLMVLQQKYSLSANWAHSYLWQLHRHNGMLRGMPSCAIRDSIYCGAYLGFAPALKEFASEQFEKYPALAQHNHWLPFVLAGPTGGLIAAILTQPVDCIKSRQQSSFKKISMKTAALGIYREDGRAGFFKGIRGRAKRVSFGVVVLSYVNDKVQLWLMGNDEDI